MMKEYNLEIDDFRWYLSKQFAFKFLDYDQKPEELMEYIWSGTLEGELYNMEEKFLEEMQVQLNNNWSDEVQCREVFNEIVVLKSKRG